MKIPVPDPERDEHPALCYAQAVTMERCTYPRGHAGTHQWAAHADPITVLNGTTGRSDQTKPDERDKKPMAVSEQTTAVVMGGTGTGTGDGQVIITPQGQPNIILKVVTPFMVLLIRAAKTYVQTLSGLMATSISGSASQILPAGDFFHTLTVCAGLSIGAAVMSILTNLPILFSELGEKFPTLKV